MSESDHTIVTTKILKTNLHLSMTQEYSVNNTNQLGKPSGSRNHSRCIFPTRLSKYLTSSLFIPC